VPKPEWTYSKQRSSSSSSSVDCPNVLESARH